MADNNIEIDNTSTDKDPKQDARNSRLVLRKNNEEVLRKKLQLEAKSKCDIFFKEFSECAKENNLMVVFKCRDKNRASKYFPI